MPFESWNDDDTRLRDVLAALYYEKAEIRRVAEEARLPLMRLNFEGNPVLVWHGVIKEAKLQNKREALIQVAQSEYPSHELLELAANGSLTDVRGVDIDDDGRWHSVEPAEKLEKIIGKQSTILPISFLETGLERSRAVARVMRPDGTTGSGFLIEGDLLVTNHHVIRSLEEAEGAKAQFNVQRTATGLHRSAEDYDFKIDRDRFATSKVDDWTVIGMEGEPCATWSAIPTVPAKAGRHDRVIIIQHPGGGEKAIALYHNIVTFAGGGRVQYLTDTLPGSSGSPVFNNQWQLVAVHHSGGWVREPGTKHLLFRNEGICFKRILNGAGHLLQQR